MNTNCFICGKHSPVRTCAVKSVKLSRLKLSFTPYSICEKCLKKINKPWNEIRKLFEGVKR